MGVDSFMLWTSFHTMTQVSIIRNCFQNHIYGPCLLRICKGNTKRRTRVVGHNNKLKRVSPSSWPCSENYLNRTTSTMCAGALVSWLWEEAHVLKIMGSNPSILHGHFSHYFAVKLYWWRPKINEKEAGDGPLKTFTRGCRWSMCRNSN